MPKDADARFLQGPAGRLDSRWHGPGDGPPIVLLHPHPLVGGSMGSRLVYDLAVGLAAAGWRAVRFDFRGVGRSEGEYGDGVGEADDAAAVVAAVAAETGRAPVLVGYSFGGAVACRVVARAAAAPRAEGAPASTVRVQRLVLVATPAQVLGTTLNAFLDAPAVDVPTHIVVGDRDPYVSVAQARDLAGRFRPPAGPAGLTVLPAARHFLEPGDNPRVLDAVLAALRIGN